MSRPAGQGAASEPSAWNSPPRIFPGGSYENDNSSEIWDDHLTTLPHVLPPQRLASPGDGPGNQPNNPYCPPTCPLCASDQGIGNNQDTHARENDPSVLAGLPIPWQALGAPECAYYGTGDDYFDHQNYGNFSPTLLANFPGAGSGSFSPIPQTQDSPVVDGSNLGGQYSSTWQDSNLYLLDGGRDDFLGSPVAELYDRPSNPHPGFDGALVTPIVSNEAAVLEHINSLPPHPAGMVGNQRVTQVPAESPALPVANEKLGIQYSGKRKRSASPDGRPKKKRARRKPRQEQTQTVQDVMPLPTRPDFLVVPQITFESENVQNWKCLPPIEFTVSPEEGVNLEGINLDDALNQRFSGLNGRDDAMFTDENIGSSVSCRMKFLGHRVPTEYKPRQIVTKNHKKTYNPITKQKLAYYVAKLVDDYLEKGEAPFRICLKDMFLTKLLHVSQASWQPELWYRASTSASS